MNNEMNVKQILDILMSDYLRKLYTFCLRETRNHADAEDLCQDIVTEIVSSARSPRHPGALPGWVWTIARRTHSRWLKQRESERHEQATTRAPARGSLGAPAKEINAANRTGPSRERGGTE